MNQSSSIPLKGAPGSPYTRKMIAVMRYRRMPSRLIISQRGDHGTFPKPKVELLPTFYLPNAQGQIEAVTDSTPIIRRFERELQGRSVIPTDPALRFVDELIEDYGDEWITKAMFHYRWHYRQDIDKAGTILPLWRGITAAPAQVAEMQKAFAERQIHRLRYVGSSQATAGVIEDSYLRFLEIFERHLHQHPFWLGARPGSGDFAIYGQLTQLAHFDPTPAALTLAKAPRVHAWVYLVDDLSGLEPPEAGWVDANAMPLTVMDLLREIGRVYVPVMLANLKALKDGATEVHADLEGQSWTQQPFPYQGKCVQWLRESFSALPNKDAARVREWLDATGCLPLLE